MLDVWPENDSRSFFVVDDSWCYSCSLKYHNKKTLVGFIKSSDEKAKQKHSPLDVFRVCWDHFLMMTAAQSVTALGPHAALLLFSLMVCFRWSVFLSGELRPAACLGHLWMGVLHHRHAILWDFCLWVFRHVRRHHGGTGERRLPGTCWERTQAGHNGTTGRARFTLTLTTTSSPTRKHVHAVASGHIAMHNCLVYSFSTLVVKWFELLISRRVCLKVWNKPGQCNSCSERGHICCNSGQLSLYFRQTFPSLKNLFAFCTLHRHAEPNILPAHCCLRWPSGEGFVSQIKEIL